MKVVLVGTDLHNAEQFITGLMQQPAMELIDIRRYPYSYEYRSWARDKSLRLLYGRRYHIAGEYFWNCRMEPGKLREGIRGLAQYISEGKELILLCAQGIDPLIVAALRGAVEGVEISTYNGVAAVKAKQQVMF